MKTQKGITVIALIITIVVLLILAVVTINAIQGDGIITKARDARDEYQIAQEKENLQTALYEYKMQSVTQENANLENFLNEKYGKENVQLNTDKSITVTMESGNKYVVTEETVTLLDDMETPPEAFVVSISLDKEIIYKTTTLLENEYGEYSGDTIGEIGTLTVNSNVASEDLVWTVASQSSGITIEDTDNTNTKTITSTKTAENTTITVSYSEDSSIYASCNIIAGALIKVDMWNGSRRNSYSAIDGMTWAQWIESEYNTYVDSLISGTIILKDNTIVLSNNNNFILKYYNQTGSMRTCDNCGSDVWTIRTASASNEVNFGSLFESEYIFGFYDSQDDSECSWHN